MKFVATISGGKDGLFSYYLLSKSRKCIGLLHMNIIDGSAHNLSEEALKLQASAVNLPVFIKKTTRTEYKKNFLEILSYIKENYEISHVSFGDIYLEVHKEWEEKTLNEIGLKPLLPLWKISSEKILNDFLKEGFKTVIVSVKKDILPKKFIGRILDENLIREMQKYHPSLDVCGENGEFHTFVINGPCFKKEIKLNDFEIVEKENHFAINIKKASLL